MRLNLADQFIGEDNHGLLVQVVQSNSTGGAGAVDPDVVDPDVVDPVEVDPVEVCPNALGSDVVDPEVVDPEVVAPDDVDPVVVCPNALDPEAVDPGCVAVTGAVVADVGAGVAVCTGGVFILSLVQDAK